MDTKLHESLGVALKEAEEGALVAGVHKALGILKENGLLFEAQLEPQRTGMAMDAISQMPLPSCRTYWKLAGMTLPLSGVLGALRF